MSTPVARAASMARFIYDATIPVVMNESGHGAESKPSRYGPSSEASLHARPVAPLITTASFCIPESDRAQVRTDTPSREGGATSPIVDGSATSKKRGLGSSPRMSIAGEPSFARRMASTSLLNLYLPFS